MATIIVPLYGLVKKGIDAPFKLSTIAKARRLTFSSVLKIGSYIIAIDAMRKKLLYFKNMHHTKSCVMIDLNHVSQCSIRKQYKPIEAGALNTSRLADFLKSISMIFHFKKRPGSLSIPLHESGNDQMVDVEALEREVKTCEMVISNLIPPQIVERA
jgi:hypothetical protein